MPNGYEPGPYWWEGFTGGRRWGVDIYLEMMLADIEASTISEERYKTLTPSEQGNWYTPKEAIAAKETLRKLVAQNRARPELLPNWAEARSLYAQSVGREVIPNRLRVTSTGEYFTPGGIPVAGDIASRMLSGEYPEEEGLTEPERLQHQRWLQEQETQRAQWGAAHRLEREQMGLAQQRWQAESEWEQKYRQAQLGQERARTTAELRAHPRNWIEAYMYERATGGPGSITMPSGIGQAYQSVRGMPGGWVPAQYGAPSTFTPSVQAPTGGWGLVSTPATGATVTPSAIAQGIGGSISEALMAAEPYIMAAQSAIPPMPAWMQQYVPGGTQPTYQSGGQTRFYPPGLAPMAKAPAKIASPQAWQTMLPGQREMLGGYLEWAGQGPAPTLEDYQQLVASMIPRRGERGERWMPMRQV